MIPAEQFLDLIARLRETAEPYVYPGEGNGCRFEWSIGDEEPSLDVDFDTMQAEWHSWNKATNQDEYREIDITKPDEVAFVTGRLKAFASTLPITPT